jgi:hypothetical protein
MKKSSKQGESNKRKLKIMRNSSDLKQIKLEKSMKKKMNTDLFGK